MFTHNVVMAIQLFFAYLFLKLATAFGAETLCAGEWVRRATGEAYCELHVHDVSTDAIIVPLMTVGAVFIATVYMTLALHDTWGTNDTKEDKQEAVSCQAPQSNSAS